MPFEFELVKLSVGRKGLIKSNDLSGLKAIWYDLQPNSFAWNFMSERLITIVNNNLSGRELCLKKQEFPELKNLIGIIYTKPIC